MAILGTRGFPSYYGGFETAVRHLAPFLANRGWKVSVYSRPGQTLTSDHSLGVTSIITPGISRKSLSTLSFGLTSALHAALSRPDIALIMNCANGFWIPLLRLRGVPVVVNVDGLEWERAKWGRVAQAVFRLGAKFTALFANRLIFDAEAIGSYWRARFRRDGVFIPYGGTPSPKLPRPKELPAGPYVLVVARFVPENSIPEFLAAVPNISQVMDVVLVGSSGDSNPSELDRRAVALAYSNSKVHYLGHISDDSRLFAIWQHSSAYFHGHSVGGTNPALVQAMMLGVNIVARDTVYNREVLGRSARYCSPDPRNIASQVLAATVEPSLGELAAQRAMALYSWKGVCEAYESTLLSTLGADAR